jgi:two-component system, cell cycle sensor histidine kinase and response regulator CckA
MDVFLQALLPVRIAVDALLATILCLLFLRLHRERFLLYWALYWAALAAYQLACTLLGTPFVEHLTPSLRLVPLWIAALCTAIQVVLIVLAAASVGGRLASLRVHTVSMAAAFVAATVVVVACAQFVPLQSTSSLFAVRCLFNAAANAAFCIAYARSRACRSNPAGTLVLVFGCLYTAHLALFGVSAAGYGIYGHPFDLIPRLAGILLPVAITAAMAISAIESAALAKSRSRLIWEASNEGMRLADSAGTILDVNEAFCRLVEKPRSQLIGEPITCCYLPENADSAMSLLLGQYQQALDAGRERQRVLWNGRHMWLDISVAHMEDRRGRLTLTVFRDITERKNAEAAQRENLAKIRAAHQRLSFHVNCMPLAVIEWDCGLHIRQWNPAATQIFGWSSEEALNGDGGASTVLPEMRAVVTELLASPGAIDGRHGTTLCNRTRSGEAVICEWFNVPLRDENGPVTGMLSMANDITARTRAEESLRHSEERHRVMIENFPDAVVVHDEARIAYANPAAVALFGADSAAALVARPVADFSTHGEAATLQRQAAALLRRGGAAPLSELTLRRMDGTPLYAEVLATALAFEGKPAIQTLVRDISVRRQMEEQKRNLEDRLQHAQKLESLGRLAGGVAHDFNNLLTVINGYSDLLLKLVPEGDRSREPLGEIRSAGERAAELTGQLLAFSRKQVSRPEPTDLNALVHSAENMLRRLIGEEIEMVMDLGPETVRVLSDPGQIHQVLMNLAVNARDAMPDGGVLRISTSIAAPKADRAPGRYVRLGVTDTGIGMPPEVLEHIFEPFFTARQDGKGTGLGLSMVYGIVEQNGGWIEAASQPGKGTVFGVYLPVTEAVPTDAAERQEVRHGGDECILVVEDQDAVRRYAVDVLRSSGYQVLQAAGGTEALILLERNPDPVDLLLTDVVMPGMNGRRLAERVTEMYPHTRVLFTSGYPADVIASKGILQADVNYLPKPVSPETLLAKVRHVLNAPAQGPGRRAAT